MKFNPTDKSNSIIAHIDFLLFGNGSTFNSKYSLVDRTRNVNIAYDDVVGELFKADPNFMWDDTTNTDFPIATQDLEASRTNYVLPDSLLIIHRVRVKDSNGKFKTLTPRLRKELSDGQLEAVGVPNYYFKIDNAVFPIPVPNYGSTSGIEIELQRGGNYFATTDTDISPGFNPQFHKYLAIDAAFQYAIANGMTKKMNILSGLMEREKMRIREHYQMRSPDEKPRLRLKPRNINNYGLSVSR